MVNERIALLSVVVLLALSACDRPGGGERGQPSPEAPTAETPTEEAPKEEAPAEEAPADEAPAEEAPAEEAPEETTPPRTYSREWAVSPSGSDSAEGSAAAPFRTIGRALRAVGPGERITVGAGTYAERLVLGSSVAGGEADRPIRLQGEGMPRLVPQPGTESSMVVVERPYWELDGFEIDVQGQAKFAVMFRGDVRGAVLSGSNIHGGKLGAGVTTYGNASGVTIEGNEIHHFDRGSVDSHGVLVQRTSKDITIRGNVIHHNSGDSIQCEGPEDYDHSAPADGVWIEDNELYSDREQAVDIKTCHNVRIRGNVMRDYLQALPGGCAVVVHMSARNVTIDDNDIFNVGKGIAIGGNHVGPVPTDIVVVRNRISNVVRGYQLEGIAIRLENSSRTQILHNTFSEVDHAALRAGGGEQGATSTLVIKNNIFAPRRGGAALDFGVHLSGLVSASNLFAPGADVVATASGGGREALSVAAWQATGQDAGSRQADPQLAPGTLAPGVNAVDWGEDLGFDYCGKGPDVGAVETGC